MIPVYLLAELLACLLTTQVGRRASWVDLQVDYAANPNPNPYTLTLTLTLTLNA